MDLLTSEISNKIKLLNANNSAVIFIVTGGNGTGKSVITKQLLCDLPFHQSFNLGAVTKTIRFLNEDIIVSKLENFNDKNIDNLFTPIVQYACAEYQKNGVNIIIDGVQIDTKSHNWKNLITGGVILSVENGIKQERSNFSDTHFNRKIDLQITDDYNYVQTPYFININNGLSFVSSYNKVLEVLNTALDRQLMKARINDYATRNR